MAEYVALEKSIYKTICRKPFTSIPTKPTWSQKELFVEEAEHIRLEMSVSYTWVKDYGLLAEIHGAAKYLLNTVEYRTHLRRTNPTS